MKLEWIEKDVPSKMETRQVYAVVFDNLGRILLKVDTLTNGEKSYNLAGGTPEVFDKDIIATLRREYIEEVNTTLLDPIIYMGYQCVDEENKIPPYAQIRMTAVIDKIGKKQPDPDNQKTYERILVKPETAIKLLNWGKIGEQIVTKAVEIAKTKFNLKFSNDTDEIWDI